jgi:hypothetical protein
MADDNFIKESQELPEFWEHLQRLTSIIDYGAALSVKAAPTSAVLLQSAALTVSGEDVKSEQSASEEVPQGSFPPARELAGSQGDRGSGYAEVIGARVSSGAEDRPESVPDPRQQPDDVIRPFPRLRGLSSQLDLVQLTGLGQDEVDTGLEYIYKNNSHELQILRLQPQIAEMCARNGFNPDLTPQEKLNSLQRIFRNEFDNQFVGHALNVANIGLRTQGIVWASFMLREYIALASQIGTENENWTDEHKSHLQYGLVGALSALTLGTMVVQNFVTKNATPQSNLAYVASMVATASATGLSHGLGSLPGNMPTVVKGMAAPFLRDFFQAIVGQTSEIRGRVPTHPHGFMGYRPIQALGAIYGTGQVLMQLGESLAYSGGGSAALAAAQAGHWGEIFTNLNKFVQFVALGETMDVLSYNAMSALTTRTQPRNPINRLNDQQPHVEQGRVSEAWNNFKNLRVSTQVHNPFTRVRASGGYQAGFLPRQHFFGFLFMLLGPIGLAGNKQVEEGTISPFGQYCLQALLFGIAAAFAYVPFIMQTQLGSRAAAEQHTDEEQQLGLELGEAPQLTMAETQQRILDLVGTMERSSARSPVDAITLVALTKRAEGLGMVNTEDPAHVALMSRIVNVLPTLSDLAPSEA